LPGDIETVEFGVTDPDPHAAKSIEATRSRAACLG
jgi:hypothetical protein